MADDKRGREKQAREADRQQRERAVHEQLERWDETEPPVDISALSSFEADLDTLAFPVSGTELVRTVGQQAVDTPAGTERVAALLPDTTEETFDSSDAVRLRLQRPTIAAAMKQIVEASDELAHEELGDTQRKIYEKTLRALKAIDADDDDEGVEAIRDWIVEQIHDDGHLPESRAVRREAARFCRANGYEIRDDEWLGI